MFIGRHDVLATVEDAVWARDQIGSDVFHFQVIDGGHLSFCIGRDMSYFIKDVIGILRQYQAL
jgi:surfactin synthase thioesterase subunit